ncbi:hypothetical protein F4780DRAFT_202269 [Xylariomycetidae sp. FL0641]|nr:hypothetical protein F4780DRAFT_202269 [Xylariomycetidae sp. FL0641]
MGRVCVILMVAFAASKHRELAALGCEKFANLTSQKSRRSDSCSPMRPRMPGPVMPGPVSSPDSTGDQMHWGAMRCPSPASKTKAIQQSRIINTIPQEGISVYTLA